MLHGDIIDKFHENDGFSDARAAEQPDLPAARVWGEQIDDLDAGFQRLDLGLLIDEFGSRTVDWIMLFCIDGRPFIDRFANDIEHPAQRFGTDRDADASAGIHHVHTAYKTFRRVHGDAADRVFSQMLGDFHHQVPLRVADRRVANLESIINGRERAARKFHIDDRAQYLCDLSHIAHRFKTSNYRARESSSCSWKRRTPEIRACATNTSTFLSFQSLRRADNFHQLACN